MYSAPGTWHMATKVIKNIGTWHLAANVIKNLGTALPCCAIRSILSQHCPHFQEKSHSLDLVSNFIQINDQPDSRSQQISCFHMISPKYEPETNPVAAHDLLIERELGPSGRNRFHHRRGSQTLLHWTGRIDARGVPAEMCPPAIRRTRHTREQLAPTIFPLTHTSSLLMRCVKT